MIVFSIIAVLFLAFFILIFLRFSFTKPVKILTSTINDLTYHLENDDFSFPINKSTIKLIKRKDEIGVIIKAFQNSYDRLNKLMINIGSYSEKVQNQSNRINGIINTIPDLLLICDKNGFYKEIYSYDNSLLLRPKDYLLKSKSSIKDILSKKDIVKFTEAIKNSFLNKEMNRFEYELLYNNEKKYFEARIVTLNEDEVIILSRDITQNKLYENRLKESKQYAEKANKLKSVFVSKITHDLKTPLNGIYGLINLIKEITDNEEIITKLNFIDFSVNRMLVLINDLLDLSKIENNTLTLNSNKFDLRNDIKNLLESIRIIFNKNNNEIIYNISHEVPNLIIGDNYRLDRILQNLLSNSNNFTENGKIELKIDLEKISNNNCTLKFMISDTGKGIEKTKLDKLFLPYYQAHKFDGKGTGLGLALCKELIQLMNGEISIESEINIGTKVFFKLVFDIPSN